MLLLIACLCFLVLDQIAAQLSNPIANNKHISVAGNKFLERTAAPARKNWPSQSDEDGGTQCSFNLQLKWMAETTSSVYATPIITDLYADGYKEIIVPSFVHHLEVFQGDNGAQAAGFPAFHEDKVHASPLLYDIDHDGIQDILVSTYSGEILFYQDTGKRLPVALSIPNLAIDRNWFQGLVDDGAAEEHPEDVGEDTDTRTVDVDMQGNPIHLDELRRQVGEHAEALKKVHGSGATGQRLADIRKRINEGRIGGGQGGERIPGMGSAEEELLLGEEISSVSLTGSSPRKRPPSDQAEAGSRTGGDSSTTATPTTSGGASNGTGDGSGGSEDLGTGKPRALLQEQAQAEADPKGPPSEEAVEAIKTLRDEDWGNMRERLKEVAERAKQAAAEAAGGDKARAAWKQHLMEDAAEGGTGSGVDGGDVADDDDDRRPFLYFEDYAHLALDYADEGWGWDEWRAQHGEGDFAGGIVHVDPHILCTPALGDLDGDGAMDLVIPVTYLYDRAYYDSDEHRDELPKDLDLSMYVASGVVVYDLVRRTVKWSVHLDLTTDHVSLRAYAYSTPTLVDLDHDGKLEMLMGTSVGLVYALSHNGTVLPGWPVQMGEVQAQVAAADVDGDGWLEVFAVDTRGSIAMFSVNGTLLWDAHLRATVSQAPTFADANGDGRLDCLFSSSAGEVFAMDAQTGRMLENFPFSTGGRILAPVTPLRLLEGSSSLQLIVPSFDGFLYAIDASTGCADTVDLSDTSYSAVLVDDLDGDGRLELLVSTMSGHLYSIGTPAYMHPLKTWPQQVPGMSNFVSRHAQTGIYARKQTRAPKDIRGLTFPVEFKLVDVMESPEALAAAAASPNGTVGVEFKKPAAPYAVKVLLTNIDTASMNAGEQPVIGMQDVFQAPGRYVMHVPCPRSRATAVVRIEMRDANGVLYVDEFQQSFHVHFDKLLKWLVAAPPLIMGLILLVTRPEQYVALPT